MLISTNFDIIAIDQNGHSAPTYSSLLSSLSCLSNIRISCVSHNQYNKVHNAQ